MKWEYCLEIKVGIWVVLAQDILDALLKEPPSAPKAKTTKKAPSGYVCGPV